MASLEAEPVLYQSCTRPTWNSGVPWTEWKERSRECYEDDLRFTDTPDHAGWINKCRKLYTTPPVPVIQADVAQAIENLKQKLVECNRYNYCADAVKGVEDACHAAMLQGIQPVSQTYNLPELIEGMEVSIDVSTCDADLGNRYFGTVTEALELDTAKNGYILLVQDAEPNFDVNGNSPVTPARLPGGFTIEDAKELHEDLVRSHISQALSGEKMKKKDRDADLRWIHGVIVQAAWFVKASLEQNALSGNSPVTPDGWISCSERMPNDAQWCVVDAADGYYVQCWSEGQGWLGDDISLRNCDVIRWMPLPEPPQEVK
ncbi:DUF551 domain-containing protein [Escherichia coli]